MINKSSIDKVKMVSGCKEFLLKIDTVDIEPNKPWKVINKPLIDEANWYSEYSA